MSTSKIYTNFPRNLIGISFTERQRGKMQFNIGILFIATVLLLGASADNDSDDDNVPDDVDIDDDNDGIIDAG